MHRLFIWTLFVPFACASDPATLHVDLINNRSLSFSLENHYESPVTKFEIAANFGENLGCSITADVKRPADLHPPGTCGLPVNPKTGEVTDRNWKARIVYVEFANGMHWTPKP